MAEPIRLALCDAQGRELSAVNGIEIAPFLKVASANLIPDSLNEFPDHQIVIEGADEMAAAFLVPHNTVKVIGLQRGEIVWGLITDPEQQVTQDGNKIILKVPNITEQCHLSSVGLGYVREGAMSFVVQDIASHRYGWSAQYITPPGTSTVNNATPIGWLLPPNADSTNTVYLQGAAIEQAGGGSAAVAVSYQSATALPAGVSFLAAQGNANIICGITGAGSYFPGPNDIQYAVFCMANGQFAVYEPLASVQTIFGNYAIGDIFGVILAQAGSQWTVSYTRNGAIFYAHVIAQPPATLIGKGWVFDLGARIENAMLTYPSAPEKAWWKATGENDSVLGSLYTVVTNTGLFMRQAKDSQGQPLRAFEIGPLGSEPTITFQDLRGGDPNAAANEPNSDIRIIDTLDQTIEGSRLATITTPLGGGTGDSQVTLRRLWRVLNDPSYPYYGQYMGSPSMPAGYGGVFPAYDPRFPIGVPSIPHGVQQALAIGIAGGNIYSGVGVNNEFVSFSFNGANGPLGVFLKPQDGTTGAPTADQITAALEAISTIGAGNIVVEGPLLTFQQEVAVYLTTFGGTLALSAQPPIGLAGSTGAVQCISYPAVNPRGATADGRFIYDVWDASVYDPTNEFRVDGTDSSVSFGSDATEMNMILVEQALYTSTVERFKRQSEAHSSITVTVLGNDPPPRVGENVHVDYRDIRTRTDGTEYLAAYIVGDYRMMRHQLEIQGDKITSTCLLSNRSRYLDDPNAQLSDALSQFEAVRSVPQNLSVPWPLGNYEKECDSQHPATMHIPVPDYITRFSRAPLHVEVLPPRSTVDTRVADSGDHSHQIFISANAINFSVDVSPPVGAHSHISNMPYHNHGSIDINNHGHGSVNISGHGHTGIDINNHGHGNVNISGHGHGAIGFDHGHGDTIGNTKSGSVTHGGLLNDGQHGHKVPIFGSTQRDPTGGNQNVWVNYSGTPLLQTGTGTGTQVGIDTGSQTFTTDHNHGDNLAFTKGGGVSDKTGTSTSTGSINGTTTPGVPNLSGFGALGTNGISGATAPGVPTLTGFGTLGTDYRYDQTTPTFFNDNGTVHVSVTNQPVTLSTGNQGATGTDGRHSHALQLGVFEPSDLNVTWTSPPLHLEIDSGDGNFVDRTAQLGGPWETNAFDIPDISLYVSIARGSTIHLRFTPAASSGNTTGLCAVNVSGTWTAESTGTGSVVYAASR